MAANPRHRRPGSPPFRASTPDLQTRRKAISGGTEIAGSFVRAAPNAPVWAGKSRCAASTPRSRAWNEHGAHVVDEVGELVVTRPMPSMPVSPWNDPEQTRYRDAYLATYTGVRRQGDWITIDHDGADVSMAARIRH